MIQDRNDGRGVIRSLLFYFHIIYQYQYNLETDFFFLRKEMYFFLSFSSLICMWHLQQSKIWCRQTTTSRKRYISTKPHNSPFGPDSYLPQSLTSSIHLFHPILKKKKNPKRFIQSQFIWFDFFFSRCKFSREGFIDSSFSLLFVCIPLFRSTC